MAEIRSRIPAERSRPPDIKILKTAADLTLSPGLFDKSRQNKLNYRTDELQNAIINAWLRQVGECAQCGGTMHKFGEESNRPQVTYIVDPPEGQRVLKNITVLCGSCFSERN